MDIETLREYLNYDPETGIFTWVRDGGPRARAGCKAGYDQRGYVVIGVAGQEIRAHRLAWLYMTGEMPAAGVLIDHIDGDKANNRFANLRLATSRLNCQNIRRARRDNKLGLLGVHFRRGKFIAQINTAKGRHPLGKFDTAQEAHAAYIAAKRVLHEGNQL